MFGSVSKTYGMTGWRIGWVATPARELVEVLGHLSEALVACPSTVGQVGALAALTGPQDGVDLAVASYRERRDAAAERHVAVAPGATFGVEAAGRVRVSLEVSPRACRRVGGEPAPARRGHVTVGRHANRSSRCSPAASTSAYASAAVSMSTCVRYGAATPSRTTSGARKSPTTPRAISA